MGAEDEEVARGMGDFPYRGDGGIPDVRICRGDRGDISIGSYGMGCNEGDGRRDVGRELIERMIGEAMERRDGVLTV